jgi:hypothetical protein
MTTIAPVNVSDITLTIVETLRKFPALEGARIERSEDPDNDPNSGAYVGVYRTGVRYPIRAMGYGGGLRDQRVGMMIIARASDMSSGEACELALEMLVRSILTALFSDNTLSGAVGMMDEFEVDYTRYDRSGSVYMQTAQIQFVAITNTTVS